MDFKDYLKDKYGVNEPIRVEEIQFKSYSRPWIFRELKKLVESGDLKRFDIGIYYFPKKMFFGDSFLDPRKVVTQRFLSDGKNVYGYIAGLSLLNQAGLSTQVPNMIELVTNNESTRIRDIKVGPQKVRVRRARTAITKDNVNVLQFLDLVSNIKPDTLDETERFMLSKYAKESKVTQDDVSAYASFFPSKTMKNMVESRVVYELT